MTQKENFVAFVLLLYFVLKRQGRYSAPSIKR